MTVLHGSKDPAERDRIIDDFREGKSKVLITTNVVARGIDILQVNMVVNYDLPLTVDNKPDPETYLHRIGKFMDLAEGSKKSQGWLTLPTRHRSNRKIRAKGCFYQLRA